MAPRLDSLSGAARFEAAMACRPCARTAHFMVHHRRGDADRPPVERSVDNPVDRPVGNSGESSEEHPSGPCAPCVRLGLVVPKRHARRAVTRTLVKGQIRAGMRRHLAALPPGDWVVRLRAPFDRSTFPSARSEALADAVRAEIDRLMADAVRRAGRVATGA